jgi:hypothetical protein
MAIRVSPGCEPVGRELALVLVTLATIAGMGYGFWRLLDFVQSWAASITWTAQAIQ